MEIELLNWKKLCFLIGNQKSIQKKTQSRKNRKQQEKPPAKTQRHQKPPKETQQNHRKLSKPETLREYATLQDVSLAFPASRGGDSIAIVNGTL
jgi:hypothetical protein